MTVLVATGIFFASEFSHFPVTPGDYVTHSLILKRSSLCTVLYSFSSVLVSRWQIRFTGFYRVFLAAFHCCEL